MTIVKIGMNGVLPDNDVQYMTYITKVVSKIDKEADVTIIRGNNKHSYRIVPSDLKLKSEIIQQLSIANSLLGIKILWSQTMHLSNSIYFELL